MNDACINIGGYTRAAIVTTELLHDSNTPVTEIVKSGTVSNLSAWIEFEMGIRKYKVISKPRYWSVLCV